VNGGMGLFGDYLDQNFWNPLYNAITIGLNSKYYLTPKKHLFYEAHLFYRHWWFNNKDCEYDNVEGYQFDGIRTERQNVLGLKALFGSSFKINLNSKVKPIFDLYCGIGVRYKNYRFKTYNGTVGDTYVNYWKDKGSIWKPSIHLGLKIGVEIFK
jgi:hypothetical protein